MKTINKEKMVRLAHDILADANFDDLETVSIDETAYDDGSVRVSIELTYPSDTEKFQTAMSVDGPYIQTGKIDPSGELMVAGKSMYEAMQKYKQQDGEI